jgi:hypothetical protein
VLEINAQVDILRSLPLAECREGGWTPCGPKGGWCLIESRDPGVNLRGYVACEYLSPRASDLKQLQAELERLRGFNDRQLATLKPEDVSRAFDLAGRIYALDRSLINLNRYADLLATTTWTRRWRTRIADRLYAIDRGEIIFEGKPQQALEDENVMKALRG